MAYDEALADRLRTMLKSQKGIVEKKMFGGIAFLLNGNMCVGVNKKDLIVRLDPVEHDALLKKGHTRTFDLSGGRSMKGWMLIAPAGVKADNDLKSWVGIGVKYAKSLPKK